jgi:hypothetical protein
MPNHFGSVNTSDTREIYQNIFVYFYGNDRFVPEDEALFSFHWQCKKGKKNHLKKKINKKWHLLHS